MGTRRILIMRHAKSDWEAGIDSDHQRPLNGRGKKDAPKIAAYLKELAWVPELILCSDAVRTMQTYERMKESLTHAQVQFQSALYEAPVSTLIQQLEAVAHQYQSVMILAHNPGVSELTAHLTGSFTELTTANVLCLEAELHDWSELSLSIKPIWQVKHWLQPRQLTDLDEK